MPDGNYIVTYYVVIDDGDLAQMVDFDITKSEIIQNVIDQKYTEGAEYFLVSQLMKY